MLFLFVAFACMAHLTVSIKAVPTDSVQPSLSIEERNEIINSAAGVYRDKPNVSENLKKTVLITVLSHETIGQYIPTFQNFLCYARQYDYDILVYKVYPKSSTEDPFKQLGNLDGVKTLTYPTALHDEILRHNRSQADDHFAGLHPSFKVHGDLLKLIPALEVVRSGKDVILFDVENGLLLDPVPYVAGGDADFTSSYDSTAGCFDAYPSLSKTDIDWSEMEPNLAVLHVKATRAGANMLTDFVWQTYTSDTNRVPFQQVVIDNKAVNTKSCNDPQAANTSPTISMRPKYCFLNEVLFQNAQTAMYCQGIENYMDVYREAMYEAGVKLSKTSRTPVVVHVSHSSNSHRFFQARGLWIRLPVQHKQLRGSNSPGSLDVETDFKCQTLNPINTAYGKENFRAEVQEIESQVNEILVPGSYIKEKFVNKLYIIDSKLRKREIQDIDTLRRIAATVDLDTVQILDTAVVNAIETGTIITKQNAKTWEKED